MYYQSLFTIWFFLAVLSLQAQQSQSNKQSLFVQPHLAATSSASLPPADEWLIMMDGEPNFANAQNKGPSNQYQLAPLPIKSGLHHLDVFIPGDHKTKLKWQEAQANATPIELEAALRETLGGGQGQQCACNLPENGETPAASLWYQFIPSTKGDDLLFTSTDQGQNWYPAQVLKGEDYIQYLAPIDSSQQSFITFSNQLPKTAPPTAQVRTAKAKQPTDGQKLQNWDLQLDIFPNPFEVGTTLSFSLTEEDQLTIEVFTLDGRRIHQQTPQQYSAGAHLIDLNTSSWAGGTYFCQLTGSKGSISKKLVCIK